MSAVSQRNLIKLSKAPVEVVDVLAILVVAAMLHHGLCCNRLNGEFQLCMKL